MKEQLILFETAKLAEEKGFGDKLDWLGVSIHDNYPTQSLLQKWLREKHNIHMAMKHMSNGFVCDVQIAFVRSIKMVVQPTYEEALEHGLYEALKLI